MRCVAHWQKSPVLQRSAAIQMLRRLTSCDVAWQKNARVETGTP